MPRPLKQRTEGEISSVEQVQKLLDKYKRTLEYQRLYENKPERKEKKLNYYREHKDAISAQRKTYYQQNRENILAQQKAMKAMKKQQKTQETGSNTPWNLLFTTPTHTFFLFLAFFSSFLSLTFLQPEIKKQLKRNSIIYMYNKNKEPPPWPSLPSVSTSPSEPD